MKALIGYGKSYASFGEVVQGRLSNSEDFLITIPINLWSTCELVCNRTSEITEIDCPLEKSKEIAEKMVEKLNNLQDEYTNSDEHFIDITEYDVGETVSMMTGIPIKKINQKESEKLLKKWL